MNCRRYRVIVYILVSWISWVDLNPRIVVTIVIMMSLGVILTIQSVSAQPPTIPGKGLCELFPDRAICKPNWCDRHPEVCLKVVDIPDKISKIPFPPGCPQCNEKVIVDLNPFDFILLGKLNNSTIAIQVSPQDVLKMLSNVTSMTNSSMTAK